MGYTAIEWTGRTLNPIVAMVGGRRGWFCVRVSPGCKFCYAGAMNMWRGNGLDYSLDNAPKVEITLLLDVLVRPLSWRKPQKVFICDMTDLFYHGHSFEMIALVFVMMAAANWHTFQVLTKRPQRMADFMVWLKEWSKSATNVAAACGQLGLEVGTAAEVWSRLKNLPLANVWLGVSVENNLYADERIKILLQTPAAVRYISYEPALGPLDLTELEWPNFINALGHSFGLPSLDWVICGGESGPGARPCSLEWIASVVRQCKAAGVPVFVKQLGSKPFVTIDLSQPLRITRSTDTVPIKDRKGGNMEEWPEHLRIREFPPSQLELANARALAHEDRMLETGRRAE